MIAHTISRMIVRVSRWSSTGNGAVRPEGRPASPVALHASPKHSLSAALRGVCNMPVSHYCIGFASLMIAARRARSSSSAAANCVGVLPRTT